MTRRKRGGLIVAIGVWVAGGWGTLSAQGPSEQVDAYVLLVRAEQALRNEDHEGAVSAFQGALALYQDLVGGDSDNQRLIEYRIAYCRNQLEQLGATELPSERDPPVVVESIPLPVPMSAIANESTGEDVVAPVDDVVETDRDELLAKIESLEARVAELQSSAAAMVPSDGVDRAVAAAREEFEVWRKEADVERRRLNEERIRFRDQVDNLQAERAEWVAERSEWAAMFAEWEGIEDELLVAVQARDALKAERDALTLDLAAAEAALASVRDQAALQSQREDETKFAALIAERDRALAEAAESADDRERREFLEKQVAMLHSELDLFRGRLVASEERVRELTRQVLLKAD